MVSVSLSEKEKNSIIVAYRKTFREQIIKIQPQYVSEVQEKLHQFSQECLNKRIYFTLHPLDNAFDKIKKKGFYLELGDEEDRVYDLYLYFNESGEADSYSLGIRKRMYAFAGEAPKIIERTSLEDFQDAIHILKEKIKERESCRN